MAIRLKIDPVEKSFALAVSDMLSPRAQSQLVAKFAQEQFVAADDANTAILGRRPPHTRTVDGKAGAPLDTVDAKHGVIIFEWELIVDVLRWIGVALVDRSPEVSGDYKRGHTLFADGKEVDLGGQIPDAEEYSFTNLVPYARKIEIGKTTKGRDFVIQVPNRIYERTAKDARARFGNIAKIEFTYRGLIGLGSGSGTLINPLKDPTRGSTKRSRSATTGRFESSGGPKAYNRSEVRFPTINVKLPSR